MKIKRYTGTSSREILQRMRRELGADAVILSNREIVGGVEIVAAIDFEEVKSALGRNPAAPRAAVAASPRPAAAPARPTLSAPASAAPVRPVVPAPSQPAANPTPSVPAEMARLFAEMADLRRLLQAGGPTPTLPSQQAGLVESGFSAALAQSCAREFPGPGALKAYLRAHLPLAADPLASGGAHAFIGPTGVGKTTTIAKLAARQVLRHGADAVALITLDTYRIGGVEQLKIYGRILGVPVVVARGAEELARHLAAFSGRRHVLIDSIGLSPRDERLKEQLAWLRGLDGQVGNVLVMTAGMTKPFYQALSRLYEHLAMAGCVITKLDESGAPGAALEWLMERALPLWFCTDGQGVPEDIHAADPGYLARLFPEAGAADANAPIYPFSSAPGAPLAMQGI